MTKPNFRNKLLIDNGIQIPLAVRAASYWLICLSAVFLLTAAFPIVLSWILPLQNEPTAAQILVRSWGHFWPAFIAAFMMLPAIVWDILRTSNRIVGPIYRIRRTLDKLARGESVEPIRLRSNDYLQDLAERVNQIADQVQRQTRPQEAAEASSQHEATEELETVVS